MAQIIKTLSAADTIAINKAVELNADSLRHNCDTATTHTGSVAVIIDYSFKMGADESYTPTIAIPYKAVLAILAEQSPEMAQSVMAALNEALTLKADAETGSSDAEARLKLLMKSAPEATANIDSQLAQLPKSTRQGKVHAVNVDVIALNADIAKQAISEYADAEASKAAAAAAALKAQLA